MPAGRERRQRGGSREGVRTVRASCRRTRLVRADDAHAAERLDAGQLLDDGAALRHAQDAERERDGYDDGQAFGDGGDGERHCERAGSSQPGRAKACERRERERTADGEHLEPAALLQDADEADDADDAERDGRQPLGELVHGDLQRRLLVADLQESEEGGRREQESASRSERRSEPDGEDERERESARRTSCIMLKTTPNSLCTPVPTTTPSPRPLRTSVPMNATLLRSAMGKPPAPTPCSVMASVCLRAGLVSPVRADSSISRPCACVRRMSAGMRSPVWNVTRSPGTRKLAS